MFLTGGIRQEGQMRDKAVKKKKASKSVIRKTDVLGEVKEESRGGKGKEGASTPELLKKARCLEHSLIREEDRSIEQYPAPSFHTHYHLLQRNRSGK